MLIKCDMWPFFSFISYFFRKYVKFVKFSKQLLPRATFGEHSVSGAALAKPYLNNKYLVHKTNKHPLLVVRAILWSSFPLPDVFLVYDRKALLSTLSESATKWNSEELLLYKFSKEST